MFTRITPGVYAERSQLAGATLATAKAGRHQLILTNLTAGTDFYICFGTGASGSNFDFILSAGALAVVIDNYTGTVTASPTPSAGEINVSELFGSNYRATR